MSKIEHIKLIYYYLPKLLGSYWIRSMETKDTGRASLLSRIKDNLTPILNKIQDDKADWAITFFHLPPEELSALRDELANPELKLQSPHDFWQSPDMLQFLLHYYAWIFTDAVEASDIDVYSDID